MGSIKKLEAIVGHEIKSFSYPFGKKHDYSDETVNILKKNGIKKCATTEMVEIKCENRELRIPRLSVRSGMSIDEFSSIIDNSWREGYGVYWND